MVDLKSDRPTHTCARRRGCSDGDCMLVIRSNQMQVENAELPKDEVMYACAPRRTLARCSVAEAGRHGLLLEHEDQTLS